MPRGGRRRGAGRKPGAVTKRTRAVADAAAASGGAPLEYLLDMMHDPKVDEQLRFEAAKAAAPFVHPKLSSISATVDGASKVVEVMHVGIYAIPSECFLTADQIRDPSSLIEHAKPMMLDATESVIDPTPKLVVDNDNDNDGAA